MNQAIKKITCIGCGCDDANACETDIGGDKPCAWLRANPDLGMGICSACPELIVDWDVAESLRADLTRLRVLNHAYQARRMIDELEPVYTRETGFRWLLMRNPRLGGEQPYALILRGELDRVRGAVRDEIDPPWARDDQATQDLLLLVSHDAPIEQIATWTDDQVKSVEEWASAVHLNASDNDDVEVPSRPDFLAPFNASQTLEAKG